METGYAYFDPYTGNQVDEFGNPMDGGITSREFTGGQYGISGGNFYELGQFGLSISIGRQGPVRLTAFGNGQYEVQSETLTGTLNRVTGPDTMRLVAGSTNVVLPSGDVIPIEIAPTNISKIDYQWLAYPQEDGGYAFSQVRGPIANDIEAQAILGQGARLATDEEAANLALMYSIMTNNRDVLRDKATELGMLNEDGSPDISGLARLVMERMNLSQLRAFTSFLVG